MIKRENQCHVLFYCRDIGLQVMRAGIPSADIKVPMNSYIKRTERVAMTAQMASESRLRTTNWIKKGCNGFSMKSPTSNPMSFWTEQDVLEYIYCNHIPIERTLPYLGELSRRVIGRLQDMTDEEFAQLELREVD